MQYPVASIPSRLASLYMMQVRVRMQVVGRCTRALLLLLATAGSQVAAAGYAAHYVKLEGTSFEATAKAAFEMAHRSCQAMQAAGAAVQPASIPPGDTYTAVTVETHYGHQIATTVRTKRVHTLDPASCALRPQVSTSVHVVTPAGTCQVDLKRQRATGACDVARFLGAPATQAPATAAAATPLAQRQVIAGLECEQRTDTVAGVRQRTTCVSRAGRFMAPAAHPHLRTPGLMLQMVAPPELDLQATEVRLDTQVDARVLAPHLEAGFANNNPKAAR